MGPGFEAESEVQTQISGFSCRASRHPAPAALPPQGRDVLLPQGGVGDVPGPSLTPAAFSSFPLAVGNSILATDSSQLLCHFQDEVFSARSGPEATTWISLRSEEQQLEGNPPDLLGAKLTWYW